MILNIGNDNYILIEDIITILDKDSVAESDIFNEFICNTEDRETLEELKDPKVKSYLIVEKDEGVKIFTSKISSRTLFKRSNMKKWR